MAKYDEFMKRVLRLVPGDFAKWLMPGLDFQQAKISFEDREFEVIHKRLDTLLKLESPRDTNYLHIEFQGEPEDGFLERMMFYNVRIYSEFRKPVQTVVIFLQASKKIKELPSMLSYGIEEKECLRFSYEKIILPEISAESLIESKIAGLLTLVPLGKIEEGKAEKILNQTAMEIEKLPLEQKRELGYGILRSLRV